MAEGTDDGSFEVNGVIIFVNYSGVYAIVKPLDADLPDILLHSNVMRKTGFSCFKGGVKITVRAKHVGKGLKATEVLILDGVRYTPDMVWVRGVFFAFDTNRGIGRVDIGRDTPIFIHARQLRNAGLRNIKNGTVVEILWAVNPKGPTVTMVRLPIE